MGRRSYSSFFGIVLLLGCGSFLSDSGFGREIPCDEYSAFKRPTLLGRVSSLVMKRRSSQAKLSRSNSGNNSNNEPEGRRPSDSQSSATSPTHSVQGSPKGRHPADDEEWVVQVESTEESDDEELDPCPTDRGGPLSQVAQKTLLAAQGAVAVDDEQDQHKKTLYLKILTALTKRGRKLNEIREEYRQGIKYPDLWACVISVLGGNKANESKMDTRKDVQLSSIYNDLISDRADGVTIDLGSGPTTLSQYYLGKGGISWKGEGNTGNIDEKKREIFLTLVHEVAKKLKEKKVSVTGAEGLTFQDFNGSEKALENYNDPYVKLSLAWLYSASQNTSNNYVVSISTHERAPNLSYGPAAPISFSIQFEKEPYVRGSGIIPFTGMRKEPVEDRLFSVTPKITKDGLAFDHTEAVLKNVRK